LTVDMFVTVLYSNVAISVEE